MDQVVFVVAELFCIQACVTLTTRWILLIILSQRFAEQCATVECVNREVKVFSSTSYQASYVQF